MKLHVKVSEKQTFQDISTCVGEMETIKRDLNRGLLYFVMF